MHAGEGIRLVEKDLGKLFFGEKRKTSRKIPKQSQKRI